MLYVEAVIIGVPMYTVCSVIYMHSKCSTVILTSSQKHVEGPFPKTFYSHLHIYIGDALQYAREQYIY